MGVVVEFTDSLGRVWFGCTKNTLAVLHGDRVQVFGPQDGLRVGNITAIYGRRAEIWIGGDFGLEELRVAMVMASRRRSTAAGFTLYTQRMTNCCAESPESSRQRMAICGSMAFPASSTSAGRNS